MQLGEVVERSGPPQRQARSTACGCWPSSRCRRCRSPPSCWPASAPTSSRSSTRSTATWAAASLPAMTDPRGPARRAPRSCATTSTSAASASTSSTRRAATSCSRLAGAGRRRRRELQGRRAGPPGPRLRRRRRRAPRRRLPVALGLRRTGAVAVRRAGRRSPRSSRRCRASTSSSAEGDDPPVVAPVGALGDIGTGAVRHHRRARRPPPPRPHRAWASTSTSPCTTRCVALTDLVTNFWSMGLRDDGLAADHRRVPGVRRLVRRAGRAGRYQFERLAEVVGRPEWLDRRAPRHAASGGASTSTTSSAPASRRGPPVAPSSRRPARSPRPASPPGRATPRPT